MTETLQLVHEFTRPHKTTIQRDNGHTEYVEVLSLLDQLQEAMTANRGTGGSGALAKSPVSLQAVDIWQDIAQITLAHWPGRGRTHLAGTPLPQRVQQWAAHAINSRNPHDEQLLTDWLVHWSGKIHALFEPSVDLASPCPDCEESYVWTHDGVENVKKRALTYNQHRAWCNACGQSWEGQGAMANLARMLHDDAPVSGAVRAG